MESKPTSGSAPPGRAGIRAIPISTVPPIGIMHGWAIGARALGHAVSSPVYELACMLAAPMNPKRDGVYRAWPGRKRLATNMGCTKGKVKDVLRKLLAHPLAPVRQELRPYKTAVYFLTRAAFEAAGLPTPDCVG
jgi:hypothetical protein